MTTMKTVLAIIWITVITQQLAGSSPINGDAHEHVNHNEGAKVSSLKEKLKVLHDLLKKYYEKENSIQPAVTDEENKLMAPGAGGQNVSHGNTNQQNYQNIHQEKQKNNIKTGQQIVPEDEKPDVTYHSPRAIKSEDMKRSRDKERDTDEYDLKVLAKRKTGLRDDNAIQILAKALEQAEEQASQRRTQAHQAAPPKHPQVEAAADGPEGSRDAVIPKQSKPSAEVDDDDDKLDSAIMKALVALEREEEIANRKVTSGEGGAKLQLPLIHDGQEAPTNQQPYHKQEVNRDEVLYEELVKALIDTGYITKVDEEETAPKSKPKVIDEIENRLINDIETANQLGVSVDDLIQDLEEKAYKEALWRKLNSLANESHKK